MVCNRGTESNVYPVLHWMSIVRKSIVSAVHDACRAVVMVGERRGGGAAEARKPDKWD